MNIARLDTKARYQHARAFAQRIAEFLSGKPGIRVTVGAGANVHLVEDGAFVEASIWVPVRDDAGRVIAPPQSELAARPRGPWDRNRENKP